MEKLKQCPFCGNEDILPSMEMYEKMIGEVYEGYCFCLECGAKGPYISLYNEDLSKRSEKFEEARNKAIEKWNKRV